MASEDVVFDAALRPAGMLCVETLQDLFLAARTLSRFRDPGHRELTVVTHSGGAGVMAADAAWAWGLKLARPCER
ncbi:MAG TPA: hypothetical protein VIN58_16335 [Roseateles sp.]